jgi:hypothetical protein
MGKSWPFISCYNKKKPILNLLLYQGHEKKTQKIIPSCKSKENKTDPVKRFFIAIKLGFIP